jgi:MtN3 and saliva related transmembrane protein
VLSSTLQQLINTLLEDLKLKKSKIYKTKYSKKQTNMTNLDMLGLLASAFTTSSQVPQLIRTYKTRDVSGISLYTYVIITVGLLLWLTYGVIKQDLPLIVANSTMVLLTIAITAMKIIFEKNNTI